MLKIEVNYQVKVPQKYEALFRKLCRQSVKILRVKDDIDLSVAFVSPKKIRQLNKSYRGKDEVTDVLSFDDLNEIIICYSQAVKQAKKQKHSIKKEVSTLFVHGFLHLLGFDDRTKKGADEMSKLTERILLKS